MSIRAGKFNWGGGELACPVPVASPGDLVQPLVGVDVHVADLHLAHLVLAQQICHTALSLSLRETSKRRILKMPTQMSRVVDRMVVA